MGFCGDGVEGKPMFYSMRFDCLGAFFVCKKFSVGNDSSMRNSFDRLCPGDFSALLRPPPRGFFERVAIALLVRTLGRLSWP